jgi:hypothetical protein
MSNLSNATHRPSGVFREAFDLDQGGGQISRHFDETHAPLRERQYVAGIGEAHAPEQRLDVKSIRDLKNPLEGIRKAKSSYILRRRKHGEAMRLKAPEFVVVDKIVKLFSYQCSCVLIVAR